MNLIRKIKALDNKYERRYTIMTEQEEFEKIKSNAIAGDVQLYNKLGYAYEIGYGTAPNYIEAIRWYFKAIECGIYDESMVRLALLYQNIVIPGMPRYNVSITLLKDAVNHNIKSAYYFLGSLYLNGLGTETNYSKALECFNMIQEKDLGYMQSLFQIGNIYEFGEPLIGDKSKAKEFYEKCNLPCAKNRLSFLYLLQNYENDIESVRRKYFESYERGNKSEKYILDILKILNGRKIKAIDNLSELRNEDLNKLSERYGAIFIKPDNPCKNVHTLYSIDTIEKLIEKMNEFLKDIDDINEEKNNELDVFMQIYVKIGKKINFDFDEEKKKSNLSNVYETRNLIGALMNNKCVCGGFVELLRNALEMKGIHTQTVFSLEHIVLQVQIEENWYYVDPTTDSQFIKDSKNPRYCLLSEADIRGLYSNRSKFVNRSQTFSSEISYPNDKLLSKYNEYVKKYEVQELN